MRRSLHVDDRTAAYYLSVSEGDPRAAMMEYSEDLCTAAPFTAAVFMGFSFSASLVNIIGLDSATFCSLALSENNSSP